MESEDVVYNIYKWNYLEEYLFSIHVLFELLIHLIVFLFKLYAIV